MTIQPPTPSTSAPYTSAPFTSVRGSGRVDLAIHLGPGLESQVTVADDAARSGLNLTVSDGDLAVTVNGTTDETRRFIVNVTAPEVTRVSAIDGAGISLSGSARHLTIVALKGAQIDASKLQLATAEVDLEMSDATVWATDHVSGGVAYHSRLTLVGDPQTKIATGNGGHVFRA